MSEAIEQSRRHLGVPEDGAPFAEAEGLQVKSIFAWTCLTDMIMRTRAIEMDFFRPNEGAVILGVYQMSERRPCHWLAAALQPTDSSVSSPR